MEFAKRFKRGVGIHTIFYELKVNSHCSLALSHAVC